MHYLCSACQRTMDYPETLSFCPFCGVSYGRAASMPGRIAITSDGERTVQEKYWRLSRAVFQSVLRTLHSLLLESHSLEPAELNFMNWLGKQRRCSSVRQFVRSCNEYLQQLQDQLTHPQTPESDAPIDVEAEREHIDAFGLRLAEAMGNQQPDTLRPQWKYEPASAEIAVPAQTPSYDQAAFSTLLETVQQVKPVVFQIFMENGIFAAFSTLDQLEEEETSSPTELAQTLKELSQKDYDPLFGDQYDELILTFWRAIECVSQEINRANELPQLDQAEQNKLDALEGLLNEWTKVLNLQLDDTYQRQVLNMMYVYSDLVTIQKDAEKWYEEQKSIHNDEK